MGLYKGPGCKLCRREGIKLFLKSERCETAKCALTRRTYVPGMHGPVSRTKLSEYGIRLREKQKLKRFYYISEGQLRKTFDVANKMHGDTGEEFLQLLEIRLDNFVYRLGLADSRRQSRLFVRHGHVQVNGKKVDIPSYILKMTDVVSLSDKSKLKLATYVEKSEKKQLPTWILKDSTGKGYSVLRKPTRDEIDAPVNEQFIVEFYSR